MVAESIAVAIGETILPYLPESVLGIDIVPFLGLLTGILIACYEGLKTKFIQFKLTKADGEVIKFDNRYLVSGVIAIIVTYFTVDLVVSAGSMNGITSFGTALFIGFTEGVAVIKTFNRRVDIFIKKSAEKNGLSSDKASALADSVEFVEVDSVDSGSNSESDSNASEKKHRLFAGCIRKNGKTRPTRKAKAVNAPAPSKSIEFEDADCKTLVVKKRMN